MASVSAALPRVTIQFCTQCKWMLKAAYVGVDFRDLIFNNCYRVGQPVGCSCFGASCVSSVFISAQHVIINSLGSKASFVNVITGWCFDDSSHKSYSRPSAMLSEKLRFNLQRVGFSLFYSIHPFLWTKATSGFSIMYSGIEKPKEDSLVRDFLTAIRVYGGKATRFVSRSPLEYIFNTSRSGHFSLSCGALS